MEDCSPKLREDKNSRVLGGREDELGFSLLLKDQWERITPLAVSKRGVEKMCVSSVRDRVLQLGTSLQSPGRAATAMALPCWLCLQRGRQKSLPMN